MRNEMGPAAAGDELDYFLELLETANAIFDAFPDPIKREIEAGASERELCLMAPAAARLSTDTRRHLEVVLRYLRDGGEVTPPAYRPSLRVVGLDGD